MTAHKLEHSPGDNTARVTLWAEALAVQEQPEVDFASFGIKDVGERRKIQPHEDFDAFEEAAFFGRALYLSLEATRSGREAERLAELFPGTTDYHLPTPAESRAAGCVRDDSARF